jgi:hypothetical protein
MLVLQHVGVKANGALEIVCHVEAMFLGAALAWFSIRLVWHSHIETDGWLTAG